MGRLQKYVVALGLSLFLGGCTSEFPDDLTLIALHALPPTEGVSEKWVNVVLSSEEEFQKYVIENQYTASPEFYFCDIDVDFSYYYHNEIIKEPNGVDFIDWTDYRYGDNRIYNNVKINGKYFFSVFFNVSRFVRRSSQTGKKADLDNLQNTPRDVCIQFRGGSMTGGYRSNVVRIPKERLAEEMAHPTPGGRPVR